ncbi:hypothetical protein GGQ99_002648 [Aminobacter niigataensis]|uniref:Uncharacterized protein n=1 Tax=Aminobacter niigataensis TaxID=83265 RepID=A0ABR6L271_9HYPH|nr:hypothetical protein [Aminobacter niigataensis]
MSSFTGSGPLVPGNLPTSALAISREQHAFVILGRSRSEATRGDPGIHAVTSKLPQPCRTLKRLHDVTPCHQTPWIPAALSPPPKDLPYNPSRPCRGNTGHDGDCVGRGRRLRRRASVARRPGRFRPRVPPRALRPGCAGRCASGAGAKMPGPRSGTDGNINRRTGGREIALRHSRAIPRPPVFPPHSMARPATGRGEAGTCLLPLWGEEWWPKARKSQRFGFSNDERPEP